MMCCTKSSHLESLNAASVAKVLKKMQVLRATQEQEPVLIGCGLTLVQTEAILDKKECSKSCLRFHRSSSGYWDCYFYQDPHIEHEATRGGISNAWWDGLRQIRETLVFRSEVDLFHPLQLCFIRPLCITSNANSLFHSCF